MVAADNRRFYLGEETELPDLFPDSTNNYSTEFEKWFEAINSHYGFMGAGKKSTTLQFYGKFMALLGCFHACLKLYNCCGDMFGNFLGLFFSAWRDSLAKVQWILNPSDPTQLEAEQP